MDSSRLPGWYPCPSYPHLVDLVQWWDGSRWEFRLGNVVDDGERDARKAELGRLQSEIETAKVVLRNVQETVEATPTDNLPAALGLRDYNTIADNSESVMSEIKLLRKQAKDVLRSKSAISDFPADITSADGFSFEMSKKLPGTWRKNIPMSPWSAVVSYAGGPGPGYASCIDTDVRLSPFARSFLVHELDLLPGTIAWAGARFVWMTSARHA
jgi:hypothetical protein